MDIVSEIQNLEQGCTTIDEVCKKVGNLSKKEQIEILDNLEWLAEYKLRTEIKNYIYENN